MNTIKTIKREREGGERKEEKEIELVIMIKGKDLVPAVCLNDLKKLHTTKQHPRLYSTRTQPANNTRIANTPSSPIIDDENALHSSSYVCALIRLVLALFLYCSKSDLFSQVICNVISIIL